MKEHPLRSLGTILASLPSGPGQPTDTEAILERFEMPTLRRLRRHIRNCDAMLADERWTFADAVRERGTGAKRRWEPTENLAAVTAACRRIALADDAREPGWNRTPTEYDGEPFVIDIRTLKLHTEKLRCNEGLAELEALINRLPYRLPAGTDAIRRGEVHMHEIRRALLGSAGTPGYPVVPEAYAYNGLCTRGRTNPLRLPSVMTPEHLHVEHDEPIVAEIAFGIWMERAVPGHDPVTTLERVAAEPVDWSEWEPVETLPLHRHVEAIEVQRNGMRMLPPDELRYRRELSIFLPQADYRAERLSTTRQHTRMAVEDARLRWQEKYKQRLSPRRMLFIYSDGAEARLDELDPPLTAAPVPPARAYRDVTDSEWILPGYPNTARTETAHGYREWGDPESAIGLLRQATQATPANLSALEDLALAHGARGNEDEYRGLIREIVARGLAMLPKEFAWKRGQLPWHHIANRPFLRACQITARWAEDAGQHDAALRTYRQLLRVSPNDNAGVRYQVLRLAMVRHDWKALKAACRLVSDETRAAAMFAHARLLLATSPDDAATQAALQAAVDHHPLVASRIAQGDRPTVATESFHPTGSFGEAEDYWQDYGKAWTGPDSEHLAAAIREARHRSQRMRAARGSRSVLDDTAAIAANLEHYRRTLMELVDLDPRHRDEFWDLAYLLEKGGQRARLGSRDRRLEIRWRGFRITLTEPWQATLEPIANAQEPTLTVHFDGIVERLRNAGN